MVTILTIDEKYFSLDGIPYAKIYQPLAQGSEAIGIYLIYDTRKQLLNSTKYNEFEIDGIVYNSQVATIEALLSVIHSTISEDDFEELTVRVGNIEENQVTGVKVYQALADLPATGTANVSYKVANDSTPANNGYYSWVASAYVKDAELVLTELVPTNESESVSAAGVDRFVNKTILPYNSRMNTNTPVTSTTAGVFKVTAGSTTIARYEEGVKVKNASAYNSVFSNNTILDGDGGSTLYYKFYGKSVSGESTILISAGASAPASSNTDEIELTSEWSLFEGSLIVGTANPDRLAFIVVAAIAEYAIKGFQVRLNNAELGYSDSDIEEIKNDIDTLNTTIYDGSLVPKNSRFDENTDIVGTDIGVFEFTLGSATVDEIVVEEEGIKISITGTGSSVNFNDTSIITGISTGNNVNCQFKIKWLEGNEPLYFAVTTSSVGSEVIYPSQNWQIINVKLEKTIAYPNRVSFFWANVTGEQSVIIKDLIIDDTEIQFGEITKLDDRVSELESENGNVLSGKKLSIIGDSISTAIDNNAYEVTILSSDVGGNVQAYITKYDVDDSLTIGGYTVQTSDIGVFKTLYPDLGDIGKKIGKPLNYNTLTANQIWWGILAEHYGMEVLQNVSWSGSSACSHTKNIEELETAYGWHPATINKCKTRDSGGSDIEPDMIVIYRGTNDFSRTPYADITTFGADATSIPSDDEISANVFDYKIALAIMVKTLREAYKNAEIVLCTLNVFKRITYDVFPTRNGEHTLPEFNNAIREVANQMGCRVIEFDKSGITFENIYPTYASDSATIPTHPNSTGHAKLAEKAIIDLK